VKGVTGYYIKFYDQTFIFGTINKSSDGKAFDPTFICNYEKKDLPMCERFVGYMDEVFECRRYPLSLMSSVYKKVTSIEKKRLSKKLHKRTSKDLMVEMLDAAKVEDYEVAASIKKIIDKRDE